MGAPFTPPDTLEAIRWELDGLLSHVPELASLTPPASLERAATLWRRQALERAMEHDDADLEPQHCAEADVWVFGPSRREVAHV